MYLGSGSKYGVMYGFKLAIFLMFYDFLSICDSRDDARGGKFDVD